MVAATNTLTVTGKTNINSTITFAGTGAKTFTGKVIINPGGTWNETGAAPFSFADSLQNDGTMNASTGVHTFTGTGRAFSGISMIPIPNVTISGSYINNGDLSVGTALAGGGSLTQAAPAVLYIGGTSAITTLTATASGNTVYYNGAAQTVMAVNYYNLFLSGSGVKTLQAGTTTIGGTLKLTGTASTSLVGALSVTGNADLESGSTLNGATFNLSVRRKLDQQWWDI